MWGEHNPIFKTGKHEIGLSKFGIDPDTKDYFFHGILVDFLAEQKFIKER